MKKEEKKILFNNKTKIEKKSKDKAIEEIETLEQSQIKFQSQERKIRSLNNRMLELEKINSELKNKNFNLNLRVNSFNKEERNKKIENGNGQLKYCERIMLILNEENKSMTITELSKSCCINNNFIYPCIGFMKKFGLIEEKKNNGNVIRYSIKMKGGQT